MHAFLVVVVAQSPTQGWVPHLRQHCFGPFDLLPDFQELPHLPALCEGKGKVFALSSLQEHLCLRKSPFLWPGAS